MRNFKIKYENLLKISSDQKLDEYARCEALEINILKKQIQSL
jgi:hypothetical protein